MSAQAVTTPAEPVVSVVLIVYDDRDRLGRALASALDPEGPTREVVVVDDGSTDGTAEVAAEWARRDPRVRVVTRAQNSGGCGAPRNDGLDAARGRYVMFLDSDDELEPGAFAGLVAVAESSGVDVVLGRAARHNPQTGSVVPWQPELYTRTGVTTTAERPELVGDTLVVDKLYRRSFVDGHRLRFPVDLHYEDLVFTAAMYSATGSIAVTDVPVYRWHVRAEEGDRSITQRRAELSNLVDRVEANRRADEVLVRAGREDLREAKDRKFLAHDLALYLRDLPDRDEEFRAGLLAVLGPYVSSLSPAVRESTAQPGALLLALVAGGDPDELVAAATLVYRRRVVQPLARDGALWRWPGLSGPASDVTAIAAHLTRRGLHLDHHVATTSVADRRVQLRIRTRDPLHLVSRPERLRLLVVVRAAGHPTSLRVARGRVLDVSADGVSWEATLPLGAALRAAAVPGELQVRVAALSGWRLAVGPLEVGLDDLDPTPVQHAGGAEVRCGRTGSGHLTLTRTR